ncbi:MAG: radical SAM protein [bacterium]
MSLVHQTKEWVERQTGLHVRRTHGFPPLEVKRRFLTVRMDLHNKCNLRCTMCYFALEEVRNQPMIEMSPPLIDRIESQIWPRTRELWLSCATGPMMSKRLGDVLKRARRSGVPLIQLVTNATILSDAQIEMLIREKLDRLHVSLDGATRETYEKIRVGAKYDHVIENVRRLQRAKKEAGAARPALTIISVMMVDNYREWPELVHLAADLGADEVTLTPQAYYEEFHLDDLLWNHAREVNEALDRARAAASERGLSISAPTNFDLGDSGEKPQSGDRPRACGHCSLPWMQLVIYPDGEVTPCTPMKNNQYFGNLLSAGFDEIYFGAKLRSLRESLRTGNYQSICADCSAGYLQDLNDPTAFLPRKLFHEKTEPPRVAEPVS